MNYNAENKQPLYKINKPQKEHSQRGESNNLWISQQNNEQDGNSMLSPIDNYAECKWVKFSN